MPLRGLKIDKDKPKYENVNDLDLPMIPKSGPLASVKMEDTVPATPINLADDNYVQVLSDNERAVKKVCS
jgi:hypothetical protein